MQRLHPDDLEKLVNAIGVKYVDLTLPLIDKRFETYTAIMRAEIKRLEDKMATKDDLKKLEGNIRKDMATKNDIKNMATKDDIKNMAKKEDLKIMEISLRTDLASKKDLKDSLDTLENKLTQKLASKEDLINSENKLSLKIDKIGDNQQNQLNELAIRIRLIEKSSDKN